MVLFFGACCSVAPAGKIAPRRRESRQPSKLDDSKPVACRSASGADDAETPMARRRSSKMQPTESREGSRRSRRRTLTGAAETFSKPPEDTPEAPTPSAPSAAEVQDLMRATRSSDSFGGAECSDCLVGCSSPARCRGGAAIDDPFVEKLCQAPGGGAEPEAVRAQLGRERGVGVACRKGLKAEQPNQDTYFYCDLGRYSVACVADGHGEFGHWASHWAARFALHLATTLLADAEGLPEDGALARLYDTVHAGVKLKAAAEGFDVVLSGTTMTLVVIDRTAMEALVTWCGDSRCVIGRQGDKGPEVVVASADHKPSDPEERRRVLASGGDVRRVYDDTPWRVYVRGREAPGLAMSRALGDLLAQSVGVSHAPGLLRCSLQPRDVVLLCSDGVWEFMDDAEAIRLAVPFGKGGAGDAAEALAVDARERWLREDRCFTDDITALVLHV